MWKRRRPVQVTARVRLPAPSGAWRAMFAFAARRLRRKAIGVGMMARMACTQVLMVMERR